MKHFLLLLSFFISFNLWANPEVTFDFGYFFKAATPQIGLYFHQDDKTYYGFKAGRADITDENEREQQFNFSLDYKKFQGPSFYIGTSLSYYYFSEDKREEDSVQDFFDPKDDFHAIGVTFRFGNEWMLSERFKMGCDWLGVGYGRIVANRADNNNDTNIHFVILNLHAGYLF